MAWPTLSEAIEHRGKATGWIYVLLDPRTNLARYVGQTVDPDARKKGHHKLMTQKCNPDLERWKAELEALEMEPEMRIVGMISASNTDLFSKMLRSAEKSTIEHINLTHRRLGHPPLLNLATVFPQRKIRENRRKIHPL
jgi:hypothetical protein